MIASIFSKIKPFFVAIYNYACTFKSNLFTFLFGDKEGRAYKEGKEGKEGKDPSFNPSGRYQSVLDAFSKYVDSNEIFTRLTQRFI